MKTKERNLLLQGMWYNRWRTGPKCACRVILEGEHFCPQGKSYLDLQGNMPIDPKEIILHESCLPWPKQCWIPFVVTDHAKEWVTPNYERIHERWPWRWIHTHLLPRTTSLCIFHKVHKGFMKGWNCLTYKLKGPVWKVKKEDEEQSNIVLTNSCYGGFTLAKCFYMMPSKLKPI